MHFLFEGVFKSILTFWKDKLTHQQIKNIDNKIQKTKLPSFVSRTLRLFSSLEQYSALDFSIVGLYLIHYFEDYISPRQYQHIILLRDTLRELMKSNLSKKKLPQLQQNIDNFLFNVFEIYGKNMMTYNFHLLYHLIDFVNWFGPFYLNHMFYFEGYNKILKHSVTSYHANPMFYFNNYQKYYSQRRNTKNIIFENIVYREKELVFVKGKVAVLVDSDKILNYCTKEVIPFQESDVHPLICADNEFLPFDKNFKYFVIQ
jgi:hypothetical protein